MNLFQKYIAKHTGRIRSFKLVYFINNLFNRKSLVHNKNIYAKYGLEKSIFSSIGKKDFTSGSLEIPWLDKLDAKKYLADNTDYKNLSPDQQQSVHQFIDEGYIVLKAFYSPDEVQTLNEEIIRLQNDGKVDFNYTGKKLMESYKYSGLIKDKFFKNKELLCFLNFLMGKKIVPFHTINFIEGSEQKAHSDSIHMTTEPEGHLIAAWTALEPTDANNGPLFYYPKSHKLPYITCQDYDSGNNTWLIGNQSYKRYEDKIQEMISELGLEKSYFYASPGDVFIWHANLLHGGDPILEKGRTRKSMVAHYFCEDVICYHEISQRPALIPEVE